MRCGFDDEWRLSFDDYNFKKKDVSINNNDYMVSLYGPAKVTTEYSCSCVLVTTSQPGNMWSIGFSIGLPPPPPPPKEKIKKNKIL